ncbi:hypothetical protein GCM10010917_27750 [Paenibacillus physcomitrellae]|uniref:Uncharacterized protein n=1 Tax=Paenibacillus physcomitrellae TaxID=1619311 RepID=A0ABQ1GCC0_9BACL|nr:hypothetical protein GCM10010917_27750 [Paenibacillus physcomitrellae]
MQHSARIEDMRAEISVDRSLPEDKRKGRLGQAAVNRRIWRFFYVQLCYSIGLGINFVLKNKYGNRDILLYVNIRE